MGGACKHLVIDRLGASGLSKTPETFGALEAGTADPMMTLRAALFTQRRLDVRRFAATTPP